MNIKVRLLCALLSFSLFQIFSIEAFEDEEAIQVSLDTESPLQPLYLVPLVNDQSQFNESYLKKLEDILAFDLDHNGRTRLAKQTSGNNDLATQGPFEEFGSLTTWKDQNIFYVIKIKSQGNSLSALALNTQESTMKKIDTLPLTGNLNQDRKQVHKLADTLNKALFGTEGIASTRILYTVKDQVGPNKWIANVWEADYDGGNARQITRENALCVTPAYIPPKPGYATGGFVYVSYQIGQPKLYAAALKDGIGKRLLYLRGNQLMPAISPQRDKVAFISDITGNPDLFLQPFNPEQGPVGKPYQIFSARQATQGTPTFSPDGQKIAFVSDKDGSPRIYVISIPTPGTSLNNIKATLITKRNRENSAPAWAPDGTKIAYCAKHQGDRQIWVYDFTTQEEKQLTQGPGNKENPSWAPDSLHLVFNSADDKACDLYLIHLYQSEATKITGGKGEKRFPCWEPRPTSQTGNLR